MQELNRPIKKFNNEPKMSSRLMSQNRSNRTHKSQNLLGQFGFSLAVGSVDKFNWDMLKLNRPVNTP